MSRVLRPARHIIGHFGDKSFQAMTCTGTDNSKQTWENTSKSHKVTLSTINTHKKTQNTQKPLVSKPTLEKGVTGGWLPEIAGGRVTWPERRWRRRVPPKLESNPRQLFCTLYYIIYLMRWGQPFVQVGSNPGKYNPAWCSKTRPHSPSYRPEHRAVTGGRSVLNN